MIYNISVIIPIYPDFYRLDRALNSLRNQNINIFEVICVLDGFANINEERWFEKEYSDLNVIFIHHKENRSALQARITGCNYASGNVLAFLDKDDEVDIDVYSRAVQAMNQYNADIVRFGRTNEIVEYEGICKTRLECIWFFHRLYKKFPYFLTNYIFKSSLIQNAIKELNITNELYLNMNEDALMSLPAFANSNIIVADPKIGKYLYHRDNEHSLTKNLSRYRNDSIIARNMIASYCFEKGITLKDIGYKEDRFGIPLYDGIKPIIPDNWMEKMKKARSFV